MSSQFRKRKEAYECDDCGTSGVATIPVDAMIRGKIHLCTFCYQSTGNPGDPVTKRILVQLLNVLLEELK